MTGKLNNARNSSLLLYKNRNQPNLQKIRSSVNESIVSSTFRVKPAVYDKSLYKNISATFGRYTGKCGVIS